MKHDSLKGLTISRTSGWTSLFWLLMLIQTLFCILNTLVRTKKWCVSRCLVLLCPASIHPSSMDSAVPSVSVSLVLLQLLFNVEMCPQTTEWNTSILTVYVCIKMTKMAGPCGRSGLTVPSPVDEEGNRGDDPATASCRPVLAHQSKPAAAWWQSVSARVWHHSVHLPSHVVISFVWLNTAGLRKFAKYSSKSKVLDEWI